MKNYGEELKYQREIHGLTQTQLAKATEISQQNISLWESNRTIPSIENCEKLANFYQISIDELIGREKIEYKQTINKNYTNNGTHNGNINF